MTNDMLKVRATKEYVPEMVENILVRGTNWIGDVIMSLPAISSIRHTFPRSRIAVLAKPWVADLYRACPDIDEVIVFRSPGVHDGIMGKVRLASHLKARHFDIAFLLQNAIEAAIIVRLAQIPVRAGYNSDGRGILLTHSVKRTKAIRKIHQTGYYLEMVESLGIQRSGKDINIAPGDDYSLAAKKILAGHNIQKNDMLIGIAPGASYGPAKMWFPERFAAVADMLAGEYPAKFILFGSPGDRERANRVQENAKTPMINLAGETTLKEVIGLAKECNLFISNDSGLMHLAGALDIPLIAIFGSTNPITTSPPGDKSVVIYKHVSCSPCLKKECPTDFKCMDMITVDDVFCEAGRLLQRGIDPSEYSPES